MTTGTGEPARPRARAGQKRRDKRGPYKFDAKIGNEIISYLKAGNFIEVAARVAGVSKQTVYNWMKQGRAAGRGDLWEWAQKVRRAMDFSEVFMVAQIARASKEQWQAAAWHLERKYPQRWRRRDTLEHTGPGGGPVQTATTDLSKQMTTGERRARLAELLELARANEKAAAEREASAEETADEDAGSDG